MPPVARGDLLTVFTAGAYGFVMSTKARTVLGWAPSVPLAEGLARVQDADNALVAVCVGDEQRGDAAQSRGGFIGPGQGGIQLAEERVAEAQRQRLVVESL